MPDYLKKYLEGIDACMFSGCDFHEPENRATLREYMASWEQEMASIEATLPEAKELFHALKNAVELIEGLAEQQAMPDDHYAERLAEIKSVLET